MVHRLAAIVGLAIGLSVLPASHGLACAVQAGSVGLAGFPPGADVRNAFYWAAEDAGSVTFRIQRISDDCSGTRVTVGYRAVDDTALNGADFVLEAGRTGLLLDYAHEQAGSFEDVPVAIVDDAVVEPPVERAFIELHSPEGATLREPWRAPLFIVDDDAATPTYSFGEAERAQNESFGTVRLPVFRAGDASSEGTVTYSFAPETATDGDDYSAQDGALTFAAGERMKTIELQVVNDSAAEGDETLRVELSGGAVGGISSTRVTIVDNESDFAAPRSRLHHPKHDRTYRRTDYRLREIHVFTNDDPSGVVTAEMALRKKKRSGACAWWGRSGFVAGPCGSPRWIGMEQVNPSFYLFRLPKLKPSIGTPVKNYTMYSRAADGAGNVESAMRVGKNANRFEVSR